MMAFRIRPIENLRLMWKTMTRVRSVLPKMAAINGLMSPSINALITAPNAAP